MGLRHRILLLDDDEQMLELYQHLLQQLPSQPEVTVCNSGSRAIALLESESFTLLITDLRMPKMDGLQVLAIVRRKYPSLRIIVLTGVLDEEYRSREHLTVAEVERLIEAAKRNRWGQRDATMILVDQVVQIIR